MTRNSQLHTEDCSSSRNLMDSSRKGVRPKAGAVHFGPEEGAANHVHFEEKLHDSIVMVTQEEDGSFLVKVGFLKISHKYEITFLLPVSQNLRQQSHSVPLANLYLKLVDIAPVAEGYQVKCEYIAHKEGVVREEMVLASKINDRSPVKVTLQARVLDRLHGTPMLLEGVKCIGSEPEYDSEQSDWQGFD
ncbi:adipose-secreted signaling protein [Chiloscyllium punctatum]|uniref:adipose-secreted signaling protein n=1 Tax=Chiloscyllium punctatum TaxID=137246 RepID=UPI003B637F50